MPLRLAGPLPSLLVLALAAFAPATADTVQRGVLLDRQTSQVVLMRPTGGIEAVALDSGTTRWVNDSTDLPVLVQGDTLYAIRELPKPAELRLAALKLDDGSIVAERSTELPLPAQALVDDRLGEQFSIQATGAGFDWYYRRERISGARLEPSDENSLDANKLDSATLIERGGRVSVAPDQGELAQKLAAQPKAFVFPTVELGTPSADGPRRFRSWSDLHVLSSERLEDGRYRWTLTERSGAKLGELDSDYSYLPFEVSGQLLLYVAPLRVTKTKDSVDVAMPTLVAYNLATGRPAWSREIRDTEFRGPFPP